MSASIPLEQAIVFYVCRMMGRHMARQVGQRSAIMVAPSGEEFQRSGMQTGPSSLLRNHNRMRLLHHDGGVLGVWGLCLRDSIISKTRHHTGMSYRRIISEWFNDGDYVWYMSN